MSFTIETFHHCPDCGAAQTKDVEFRSAPQRLLFHTCDECRLIYAVRLVLKPEVHLAQVEFTVED